jgi:hypothetical protein
MAVTPIIRAATEAERALVAGRAEGRRSGAQAQGGGKSDAVIFIVIGVIAAALGIAIQFKAVFVRVMLVGMGAMMSVLGVLGTRAAKRRQAEKLAAEARDDVERGKSVREYRMIVDRIVTASDEGDGNEWWMFRLEDGSWLVFEATQWRGLDVAERAWHRDVRVVLDGRGAALTVTSEGSPVAVERRALQPPDYKEAPQTLYWVPAHDAGPLPIALAGDPTAPAP